MLKGAVNRVACEITPFSPIASICIHKNWKMPGVMNHHGVQGTPGKLIIVKKKSTLFGNVRMYSIIYNTQL
jgi:hypothetical protein